MSGGFAEPDSPAPANACTVTTVAGDGDDYSKDGVGTTGSSLYRPNDVCRFGASMLLFTESGSNRIRSFTYRNRKRIQVLSVTRPQV